MSLSKKKVRRVQGVGFRVQGVRFRVQGPGSGNKGVLFRERGVKRF